MAPGLRPVPFRPPGPVDPHEAVRHVAGALPDLDDEARRALALVEVAGRPRDAVAVELSLGAADVAEALYRARKALRRSAFPLSSTGWCERAERLLSDELDGLLEPPGPARLQAHLRHCGRCVEHERRLAQARDALVRGYAELHGAPEPEPSAAEDVAAPPAELRIVPDAGLPALEPPAQAAAIEPAAEAPAADEPAGEPAAAATAEVAGERPSTEAVTETPAAEPSEAESAEAEAVAPEPVRSPRVVVGVAAHGSPLWSLLHVAAIALAVVSVALIVLAATGVERVF